MAEASAEITVYQYASNNPVMVNDPMGDLQMYGGGGGRPPRQDYSVGAGVYEGLDEWKEYWQMTFGGSGGGGGTGNDVYIDRNGKLIRINMAIICRQWYLEHLSGDSNDPAKFLNVH